MDFDFRRLEALRVRLRQIHEYQAASLDYYRHEEGFCQKKEKPKVSITSSATCVLSLVATGQWTQDKSKTKALRQRLLKERKSASLNEGNPFTLAFILEAVTALEPFSEPLDPESDQNCEEIETKLINAFKEGAVSITPYPPSPYLTQLVVRTLKRRGKLESMLASSIAEWAWRELARQLVLLHAKSKMADPFAVAYLLMLVSGLTPQGETTPDQKRIQSDALATFFAYQTDDGWPLSRPLFHYEKLGNAYCYEYEMLTQLLEQAELQDLLLEYLPGLDKAAASLRPSVYAIGEGLQLWGSGHHPQLPGPESWATASVYHFAHALDRLLAEAVRRELFRYLETPYKPPASPGQSKADFAKKFLDASLELDGTSKSLKDYVWDNFVNPLAAEAPLLASGRPFENETPRSAIFFGPPGTSKTEMAKEIAKFLGWPHLAIDPSHLLRNGMDGIQAEANLVFRMLEETERVVVLFDEFDELVRERDSARSEPLSRFLTTAMLPKLTNIHKKATLVFVIATNHVGEFDFAIRRHGRFDRVVQIMPPTFDSKMAKADWGPKKNLSLKALLEKQNVEMTDTVTQKIRDLTYGECEAFVVGLSNQASTPQAATELLDRHWDKCTLQGHVSRDDPSETWRSRCTAEAKHNR